MNRVFKNVATIGFLSHILLGGVCMMPIMALAEEPMDHDMHQEMAMSPLAQMSSVLCDGCVQITQSIPQNMGCDTGHCFSQIIDKLTYNFPLTKAAVILAIAIAHVAWSLAPKKQIAYALAPPGLNQPQRIPLRV